jgi:hypothetical protein
LSISNAVGLDLKNIPRPESGESSGVRHDEKRSSPSRQPSSRGLSRGIPPVPEPLARVGRAFSRVSTYIDPGWVAVALLIAAMLGGFTWLVTEVHRVEAKVDAVSLRLAEMPGTLQGSLQAQTDRLTALMSVERQGGTAAPAGGFVAPSRAPAPASPQARTVNLSTSLSNLPETVGGRSSGASTHPGNAQRQSHNDGEPHRKTDSVRRP